MPNLYVVLRAASEAWVIEWSTVVDAPISSAIPIQKADCEDPMILRALKHGTSFELPGLDDPQISGENNVVVNRAGKDETVLTLDQIVDHYCRKIGTEPPHGFEPWRHSKAKVDAFFVRQYQMIIERGLDVPTDFTEQIFTQRARPNEH